MTDNPILEQIKTIKGFMTSGSHGIAEDVYMREAPDGILMRHGRLFTAAPLPKTIKRGKPKNCFENAFHLAMDRPHLLYAEGKAMKPSLGIAMSHAWCVLPDGTVVDPTWDEPETCIYFGFALTVDQTAKILFRLKYHGILESLYMDRDGKAKKMLEEFCANK